MWSKLSSSKDKLASKTVSSDKKVKNKKKSTGERFSETFEAKKAEEEFLDILIKKSPKNGQDRGKKYSLAHCKGEVQEEALLVDDSKEPSDILDNDYCDTAEKTRRIN